MCRNLPVPGVSFRSVADTGHQTDKWAGPSTVVSRHDYDLPAEWAAMSDAERDAWLTAERCRRQATAQNTATARLLEKRHERQRRRANARAGLVDLGDWR